LDCQDQRFLTVKLLDRRLFLNMSSAALRGQPIRLSIAIPLWQCPACLERILQGLVSAYPMYLTDLMAVCQDAAPQVNMCLMWLEPLLQHHPHRLDDILTVTPEVKDSLSGFTGMEYCAHLGSLGRLSGARERAAGVTGVAVSPIDTEARTCATGVVYTTAVSVHLL
jgi:hypothetical protein